MWPETGSEWIKFFVGALIIGLVSMVAELRDTREAVELIIAFATPALTYLMIMLGLNRPEIARTERARAISDVFKANKTGGTE